MQRTPPPLWGTGRGWLGRGGTAVPNGMTLSSQAEERESSSLRRAKSPPVNASLLQDGSRQLLQPAHGIALDEAEASRPAVALDWQALRDGRALRQYSIECCIAPMRREVDEIVAVVVRINEPGQGDERQVVAVERMGNEQRIARRHFEGPEIGEFDEKAVFLVERRSGHLVVVVEIDRGARVVRQCARRNVPIPGKHPVLGAQVGDQWNEKPEGHGVDERRALLDRHLLRLEYCAEGLLRHGLEPVREPEHGGYRPRQNRLELRRAAEGNRHGG